MISAVCVPPADVAIIWPKVSLLIYQAMRRGDFGSFAPVQEAVLAGRSLLWLAIEDRNIHAAAVTELHATEWRKVCVIVACGGKDMKQWIHLIDRIEKFAADEKCAAVRIIGRPGWEQVLSKYRPRRMVLEKDLQ